SIYKKSTKLENMIVVLGKLENMIVCLIKTALSRLNASTSILNPSVGVYIKRVEYQKPNNFYIGGFSSNDFSLGQYSKLHEVGLAGMLNNNFHVVELNLVSQSALAIIGAHEVGLAGMWNNNFHVVELCDGTGIYLIKINYLNFRIILLKLRIKALGIHVYVLLCIENEEE
ncbi:hypothetical protein ACJX0J_007136, partial [Zea mays]